MAAAGRARAVHAFVLCDTLKYPLGFKHFDYVNPDASRYHAQAVAWRRTWICKGKAFNREMLAWLSKARFLVLSRNASGANKSKIFACTHPSFCKMRETRGSAMLRN
jgi:hypothetical protein